MPFPTYPPFHAFLPALPILRHLILLGRYQASPAPCVSACNKDAPRRLPPNSQLNDSLCRHPERNVPHMYVNSGAHQSHLSWSFVADYPKQQFRALPRHDRPRHSRRMPQSRMPTG
jgi:hypothetical protein